MVIAREHHSIELIESVDSPTRSFRQRVFVQIREQTETPGHSAHLTTLILLDVHDVLIERRRYRVSQSDSRIRHDDLGVHDNAGGACEHGGNEDAAHSKTPYG